MSLSLRTTIRTTFLLTFGMLFVPAANLSAEDLKPVPETEHVQSNCPNCQNGDINYGSCPNCRRGMRVNGRGYGHCDACGRRGRMSPGTGWCAPSKVPYQRYRVQYQKYYPNYWSGHGAGTGYPYAPMVYTPTDTSQLGYYYQHVPTWTPQPWRIPGPAHPAAWHNRACGRCGQRGGLSRQSGIHYHGYYGGYGYQNGYCPNCQAQPQAKETQQEKASEPIELPDPSASAPTPRFSVLPDVPPEV